MPPVGRPPVADAPPGLPSAAVGPLGPGSGYPGPFVPPPARPSTNGLAVTSLVTGILCCLWPAAIGFAIGGLVQLRRRARVGYLQAGQGLAVAGLVLGVVGMLLTGLTVFGLVAGHTTSILQLRTGDCFRDKQSLVGRQVSVTPCTAPHDGEVSGVVALTGTDYPGSAAAQEQTQELCSGSMDAYVYDVWVRSATLQANYAYPGNGTEWNLGRHHAVCYVRDTEPIGAPHSVRCDTSTLSADQLAFLHSIRGLDMDANRPADRARLQQTAGDMQGIRSSLEAQTWPTSVQGSMTSLEQQLAADLPAWQTAAADTTTPPARLYQGLEAHDPTAAEAAVRAALGLSVRPGSPAGAAAPA